MTKDIEQPEIQEEEIDLVELAVKLWSKRRFVIRCGLIAAVLGIIVALSIPKEYEATVILVPESTGTQGSSSMSALAALAGINVGNTGGRDAVYPGLYPDVVSSVPFALALSEVELPTGIDNEMLTLEQILTQHTSRPWWSVITGFLGRIASMLEGRTPDIPVKSTEKGVSESVSVDSLMEKSEFYQLNSMRLTKGENALVSLVNSCVEVSVEPKTQLINISVTMQDPLATASLADTVANRLTDFVVSYRTNKARQDLAFAKQINKEAQDLYYEAQQVYARAVDRNQGIVLRSASIDLERLQNEAALAYNLYNSTSQQVQVAEVKVQENTPVFTVMQPAVVPFKAAKPRIMLIIVAFTFLGVFGALGYVLIVPPLMETFKAKNQELKQGA